MLFGEFDAAGGAQVGRRAQVFDADAERRAVSEMLDDDLGLVIEHDQQVIKTMLLQKPDDVLHHGFAGHGNHGFGDVASKRSQASAEAASHDNCAHFFRFSDGLLRVQNWPR